MPDIRRLHHAAIGAHDMEAMAAFYCDVVGLGRHPEKRNWLSIGGDYTLHLMPARDHPLGHRRIEQHVALEVASLRDIARTLIAAGYKPFQASLTYEIHPITAAETDSLTHGIGTVFVADPEGNIVEFVQADVGIFAEYPLHGDASA